jgi:hypothetical protein
MNGMQRCQRARDKLISPSFSIGVFSYNTNEQRLDVNLTGNVSPVSRIFSIFGGGGGTTRWLAQSLSFTDIQVPWKSMFYRISRMDPLDKCCPAMRDS